MLSTSTSLAIEGSALEMQDMAWTSWNVTRCLPLPDMSNISHKLINQYNWHLPWLHFAHQDCPVPHLHQRLESEAPNIDLRDLTFCRIISGQAGVLWSDSNHNWEMMGLSIATRVSVSLVTRPTKTYYCKTNKYYVRHIYIYEYIYIYTY